MLNPVSNTNANYIGNLKANDSYYSVKGDITEKMEKKVGIKECKTCASRTYQDGSSDPGVSFKSPSHVSPEASTAAVNSHESEHVNREQGKAASEKRVIVSQNVQIYMDTCPECGRRYASGGKTTTVTKGKQAEEPGKGTNFDKTV